VYYWAILAKRTHLSGAFKQPDPCHSPDEGENIPSRRSLGFAGDNFAGSNMLNFTH
jgi:hypothetical protein